MTKPETSNIISFEKDADSAVLSDVGYPFLAFTEDDAAQQQRIAHKYTPGVLSRLLHLNMKEYVLVLGGIWVLLPPLAYGFLRFLHQSDELPAVLGSVFIVTALLVLFSALLAPNIELREDKVTRVLSTMKYKPYPQSHTRGRAMITEAHNIANSVLGSYAWTHGLADKSRDIRSECTTIINDILGVYSHGTRELCDAETSPELDAIQERLDDLRYFARHDMTATACLGIVAEEKASPAPYVMEPGTSPV